MMESATSPCSFRSANRGWKGLPGSGIGLFVARWLVEEMGGRLWGAPREGGGAEFGLVLPTLDESDLGEAAPDPVPAFDSIDLELSVEAATPPLRLEAGGS